jgi:hypothetical protein
MKTRKRWKENIKMELTEEDEDYLGWCSVAGSSISGVNCG